MTTRAQPEWICDACGQELERASGLLTLLTGAFIGGVWGLVIGYTVAWLAWAK